MSSGDDAAALIATVDALRTASYCSVVVAVVVIYEYSITVGREVRLFWGKKITGAAILFFLNRYIVLGFNTYALANSSIPVSDVVCSRTVQANRALQIAQYIPWAVFTGLRAFALCRSWFLSLLAFALSMVSVVINLVDYAFGVGGVNVSLFGCITVEGISLDLAKKGSVPTLTILSRTCLISADALLVGITWSRLSRRGLRHVESTNLFTEVLLRDGTLYFIILLIMNSLHLTFSLLAIAGVPLQAVSLIPLFTEPLTANLISRFLLNLQSVNQKVTGEDFQTTHGGSGDHADSLVFQRVVGSIASSFDPSLGYEDDEHSNGISGGTRTSEYELTARSVQAAARSDEVKDAPGDAGIVEVPMLHKSSNGAELEGASA
ncbi:hypothetical protein L226DRAFT_614405 [Lentinus tigrinus ALCF2SS1-7]|uniref:uncharacterized protein n=1 Tax=Lentinus tigrinus ALCF2SS1-7 TaxID=1328758 RepID=UPI00116630CF|nr:hypothetical protein L226DRAFT_614405 [Lentinus tigrinus ALCF2SS1-7]